MLDFIVRNSAYDFLDPSKEHGLLAAYIVGIAVGGALVFAIVKGVITLRARVFGGRGWEDQDKGVVEAIDVWEEVPRPGEGEAV